MLVLAFQALLQTDEWDELIERLAEAVDIEEFLIDKVDEGLNDEERLVMQGLSLFAGFSTRHGAVENVLQNSGLQRCLARLADRYLILTTSEGWKRKYLQNELLRSYFYSTIDPTNKLNMHARAGEYYATGPETDTVQAALHYQLARNHEAAARILLPDVGMLINRGSAFSLQGILLNFHNNNYLTKFGHQY